MEQTNHIAKNQQEEQVYYRHITKAGFSHKMELFEATLLVTILTLNIHVYH